MHLSALYLYPIKSLAGIAVSEAQLSTTGLAQDRRWMLVRPDGKFITARRHPQMVLLQPSFRGEDLVITHRNRDVVPLTVPAEPESDQSMMVEVWGDRVRGQLVSPLVDAWFAEQLGVDCHLVYMPDSTRRRVDGRYAQQGEVVSFADGYPYLIIGEASLADLNTRLSKPVDMRRFRPNLVFAGGEPYAEDRWASFRVGALDFAGVKPCARCVLTTVDPDTGQVGKEPLATLSGYRNQRNRILFGMNLLAKGEGTLQVGDAVKVLSLRS
jgi:uncharacterized protein